MLQDYLFPFLFFLIVCQSVWWFREGKIENLGLMENKDREQIRQIKDYEAPGNIHKPLFMKHHLPDTWPS